MTIPKVRISSSSEVDSNCFQRVEPLQLTIRCEKPPGSRRMKIRNQPEIILVRRIFDWLFYFRFARNWRDLQTKSPNCLFWTFFASYVCFAGTHGQFLTSSLLELPTFRWWHHEKLSQAKKKMGFGNFPMFSLLLFVTMLQRKFLDFFKKTKCLQRFTCWTLRDFSLVDEKHALVGKLEQESFASFNHDDFSPNYVILLHWIIIARILQFSQKCEIKI